MYSVHRARSFNAILHIKTVFWSDTNGAYASDVVETLVSIPPITSVVIGGIACIRCL